MSTEPTAPYVEIKTTHYDSKPQIETIEVFLQQADLWSPLVVGTKWEKDYLEGYLLILGVPCDVLLDGIDRNPGRFLTYIRLVNQEGDDYVSVSS